MIRPWCPASHVSPGPYHQPQPGDPPGSAETTSMVHRCCQDDINGTSMSFPGGRRPGSGPPAEAGGSGGAHGTSRPRAGAVRPRLYDGSLTERSAHPDLPLVTG
jgi:hypothetical protein